MTTVFKDLQKSYAGSLRQSLVSVFKKNLLHINLKETLFIDISFGAELRLVIKMLYSSD